MDTPFAQLVKAVDERFAARTMRQRASQAIKRLDSMEAALAFVAGLTTGIVAETAILEDGNAMHIVEALDAIEGLRHNLRVFLDSGRQGDRPE